MANRRAAREPRVVLALLAFAGISLPPLWGQAAAENPAAARIMEIAAATPGLDQGRIGYEFMDAETGQVLASRNAGEFFTPASNTKLYTTALALVRLGVNYRFKTALRTSAAWTAGETSVPDLTLVGGGDPNLSGRVMPYSATAKANPPLTALDALAAQVVQRGIREVAGDITGDDTRYPYDPYPGGWTFDDATWYYGTPVSALTVNDSAVHLVVQPTTVGDLADVTLTPEVGYFVVLNQVITDASGAQHLSISRPVGSNEVVISGSIGATAGADEEDLGVNDPALFAALALKESLEEHGVEVRGEARARHLDLNEVPDPLQEPFLVNLEPGAEIASLDSAPLWQVVQVVNKESQNLHAEMLLRETAHATRGVGTLAAGLEERKLFLTQAGVPEAGYDLEDGSGLARQDLTTPTATVTLLRYMWQRPERDAWVASLPVGGVDGSLKHRFKNFDGGDRVHAKTGSIAHVASLSGYLQTRSGRWIVFSMMANAETIPEADVRGFLDRACAEFLEQ